MSLSAEVSEGGSAVVASLGGRVGAVERVLDDFVRGGVVRVAAKVFGMSERARGISARASRRARSSESV